MAYDRETFKDRVEEHISGAWIEFYKATLASKNGHHKWVHHWRTEVRNLLDRSLFAAIKHDVRGFKDKRKAIDQVVASVRAKDDSFRRSAEFIIKRDFKTTKLRRPLDDADFENFWARVQEAIDVALAT